MSRILLAVEICVQNKHSLHSGQIARNKNYLVLHAWKITDSLHQTYRMCCRNMSYLRRRKNCFVFSSNTDWCYKKMSYVRIAVGICVQNTYSLPLGRLRKTKQKIFSFACVKNHWLVCMKRIGCAVRICDIWEEEEERKKEKQSNNSVLGNSVIVSMLVFHECSVCLAPLSHTVRWKQFTLISRRVPPVTVCSYGVRRDILDLTDGLWIALWP